MKIKISNYSFNASAKEITFFDYSNISLDCILIVTNVTDNIIIYNFADPTKGGTVNSNTLTLTYNTSSMSNGDSLLIYYDDPDSTTEVIEGNVSKAQTVDNSLKILFEDVLSELRNINIQLSIITGEEIEDY